ncbi:MAG: hybrid sensor histidine kinase/response regulator [Bacteroides graminisolvens]|uniref:ATP-binding response regulator n=1 Tax=Bacteroides graminisolvens TaxID=477666 RepID=UPI003A8AF8D2
MQKVKNDIVTKMKVAAGYLFLLAALFFSLLFIYNEMQSLVASDTEESSKTDSLLLLLRKKDNNTIAMLQELSNANSSLLSTQDLERIISEQDRDINRQRVQHRVITKRDSVIRPVKKKGFFKRLAEAFVPSKDTAVVLNTSLEFRTDTVLQPYNAADSLHQKIRRISQIKQKARKAQAANNSLLQQTDSILSMRIDSLIKGLEQEVTERSLQQAQLGREVRQRSIQTIGFIALGAVLLSIIFLTLIWRDITRSNRYRKELEKANKRAGELLEAREKMMLTITHDFKAPLGSIMGYTDLLARLVADDRQAFYLENMKSSSEHLLKLVTDLLDFHRLDLNKTEVNNITFNPAHLFDEIKVSFTPLARAKQLQLICETDPALNGYFKGDPLRIRQIANNLLSNAVKFTASGSVTLHTDYHDGCLHLTVTDTGKGMEEADKQRIFQEFTRLPGAQGEEGFGLGLSIVHKLVHLLKGNIEVESQLGQGSSFRVTLPLPTVDKGDKEDALSEGPREPQWATPTVPGTNLRVLLIDDDKIQLNLTASMLEAYGISATCCEQLEELTNQLRENIFDVLLTDVQMPAINGFDLLKLLRASNIAQAKNIPMVAVTARSDMSEESFREHGFAGRLHKPFTVQELLEVLKCTSREVPAFVAPAEAVENRVGRFDFDALLAFSADDAEAALSIIDSFITETRKNQALLTEAGRTADADKVAALAHKMLPLFTLLQAAEAAALLAWLEQQRGTAYCEEINTKIAAALRATEEVVEQALLIKSQYTL